MSLSRHPLEIILLRHRSGKDCSLKSLRICCLQGKSKIKYALNASLAKPHAQHLFVNILSFEVASPISLVVS